MKICFLSNTNCDLIISSLKEKHEVFDVDGYGQWISYALAKNDELSEFNPKYIVLVLDGNTLLSTCLYKKDIDRELETTKSFILSMANLYPSSGIVVSSIDFYDRSIKQNNEYGLEEYATNRWNELLLEASSQSKSIVRFDLKSLVDLYGRKNVYSDSMFYMGSIPYSVKGTSYISEAIDELLNQLSFTRKKVLAVDLDNTLWGGVIGEDGPENIVVSESNLGKAYQDAQKRIKEIANTGVLLAVVSKNNPEDADLAFDKNKFMILKKSDFISIKCNWNLKSQNIIELAKELNVGIDSIVFLDDNEVEREEVRLNAPGVVVVDFPKDIANLPNAIRNIYNKYFWINSLTNEDLAKKKQYEENFSRSEELKHASSLEEYLLNLNINIEINEIKEEQKERVVQLINKTNQFNTNTLRLDKQELENYLANNGIVYVANVSDKYGDNGLVVIMLVRFDKDHAIIDNFLMSCRVMSRQIEDAFIFAVEQALAEKGCKYVEASFVKTEKNKPVENLYERLGFELLDSSKAKKIYKLDLPNKSKPLLKCTWR